MLRKKVPAGALPHTLPRNPKELCGGWKGHAFALKSAPRALSQQCNKWGIVILAPRFKGVTRDHGTLETVRCGQDRSTPVQPSHRQG